MKNCFFAFLFLFTFSLTNAQTESQKLIDNILKTNFNFSESNNYIVSSIDSVLIEFVSKKIVSSRKFESFIDSSKKIRLTKSEQKEILKELEKLYRKKWSENDFLEKTIILDQGDLKSFIVKRKGYFFVIDPIFIRNNTVALTYSVNFYGDITTQNFNGYDNFSFYKLVNNKWEEWVVIQKGIYN